MPIGLHDLQLYNHNAVRNYPLATSATGIDTSGSFTLPTDLLVGLHLPVQWDSGVHPGSFYISRLNYLPASVYLTISCQVNGHPVDVASAAFAFASHQTNLAYDLVGVGGFRDTLGYLVVGSLDNLLNQPPGVYDFDLDAGRLDLDTIRPHLRGLSSLQTESDGALSRRLQGAVRLAAGRNFRLEVTSDDAGNPVIVFNAIQGEGLSEDCACGDTSSPPIKSINGVVPDDQGNLNLLGGKCFNITPQQFGLLFENPCSTPCCGPEALEQVVQQLEAFGSKATTLENFIVRLESEVTQMNLSVLGSRLGDRGCPTE